MKYTKRIRNAGISKKDFLILSILDHSKQSKVSPLSEKICMPRTSLAFRLKKMLQRNLVEKIKVNNHFEWQLTNTTKEFLLKESMEDEFKASYYKTLGSIERIFKQILSDKSEERIYFIEPYIQTKKFASITSNEIMIDLATLFQRYKNISEGVSSNKNIKLLKTYDKKVLKSMLGRMAIVYTIPDEQLQFEDMIIVYKETVYTFNFDKNIAIEIKNIAFAYSMKSIILALRSFGKKIDMNEEIRNILETK